MDGTHRMKHASEKEYEECNSVSKYLVKEFLENSTELSDCTLKSYASNLRIWLVWIKDNLGNKDVIDIKPRDYLKYQNFLINMGHSSADISNKRAAISSLNNFIETYYLDEYPNFRNCINSNIKKPEMIFVNEKNPPTREEVETMCEKLEESERWDKFQLIAYIKFCFETGCRRAEANQLTRDIINANKVTKIVETKDEDGHPCMESVVYYLTPKIRCKGKGKTGKVRQLKFSDYSMDWIKKWVDSRMDQLSALFVTKNRYDEIVKANVNTFNIWASTIFTSLLGRRFHPHALREAIATDAVVEQGKNIESVRVLLGHKDVSTTKIYVVNENEESADDELFIPKR